MGEFYRLVDDHAGRCLALLELREGEPQDVALHHAHALETPVLRGGADAGVELRKPGHRLRGEVGTPVESFGGTAVTRREPGDDRLDRGQALSPEDKTLEPRPRVGPCDRLPY